MQAKRTTLTVSAALLGVLPSWAWAQVGAPGQAPAGAPAQAPAGNPSAAPTSPQTPGTATSPGTAAGTSPGQTVSPVAGQAPGTTGNGQNAAPTATAVSAFGTGAGTSNGSLPNATGDPQNPNFDLTRTIASSVASSAALVQARRNLEIDAKRVEEARANGRPNVSANGSATRFDAATRVSIGGGPPVEVLPDHTEALSLAITQRLDLLGQVRATVNQARLQSAADRYIVDSLTNSRVLLANTTYYNLLRAIHQVQVADANLRNSRAQQVVADKLYRGQVGQKIDVLRANTLVAQAEQSLLAAQNQRDLAREEFNNLVGRPLDSPVVLLDTPGVTVGVDLPTSSASAPVGTAPTAPAFAPFALPTADVDAVNLNQNLQDAQTLRPEVLQNAVLVRVAETGIRIARFGQEPTLALSASGNYYPTTSFQTPRERTAAITATISIPLYDGGLTRARIAESRLRRDNAQTALESSRTDVALDVREAYLNLQTTARQIASANTALEQAIAARQLAQVRYEGQVGLFLEVTDAQAALVRAESAQVDAVYNYLTARARFENAVGRPSFAPQAPGAVSPTAPVKPVAPPTNTPAGATPSAAPTVTAPGTNP